MYCFIGSLLGTAVGVLPGLGPSATISILLPMMYSMNSPTSSIIFLAGIFYGAMYGGSTTSILMRLPGEAASVVTCLDGYEMAKKGRAGAALAIAAIGSFIAGTVGVVGLTFLAPPLASFAIRFGPPEYFSMTLVGILLAVFLAGGSMAKGLIMLSTGVLLANVGLDPISGADRFTFGFTQLQSGFDFITVAMGLFGLSEILLTLEKKIEAQFVTHKIGKLYPSAQEWFDSQWPIARGSLIGFFTGIIPGGGPSIAALTSYATEKKMSKKPEEFGKGAIAGVAGPESANNAASSASFIPLLTLGIPGNAAIAMIFAALMIQGVISIRTRFEKQVILEIGNNGPAIAAELQQSIFDPFTSFEKSGDNQGLGLAIARNTLNLYTGTIELIQSNAEGVVFKISLPAMTGGEKVKNDANTVGG